MDPFLGEIKLVTYQFAPRGWAFCAGQLMSIQQNQALFALLGTTYGGNGINTFALPDLRGRAIVGVGQGPGLSSYVPGETAGVETHRLVTTEIPSHNHILAVSASAASTAVPTGNALAQSQLALGFTYADSPSGGTLNPASVGLTGGNMQHDNMQPYLVLNYVIALTGIFPSRN